MSKSASTPIAIVGLDCLFPAADSPTRYWANLREGVDAIGDVPATHWRAQDHYDADPKTADKVYAKRGGFLTPVDFEPLKFGIAPRDLEATDTTQLLALHVAARAMEDAGYASDGRVDGKAFDRARTGVVLGVTGALELVIPLGARLGHPLWRKALADAGVDQATADDVVERIAAGYVPWQENSFPGLLGNVTAGRVANRLDLHGTNCVVDAACASSLSALHLAMLELQTGRADVMLSGGVDAFNDVFMYTCFSKTPALSPTGDARPFSDDADGTMLGEGVGVVVLKRLEDAQRDGDRIYAVLRGMGTASDGKGQAIYAPDSQGQARALRQAYAMAKIEPSTIELLEGHGTGTKVGDATELRGLASVYGGDTDTQAWCALGSVKSMIGHTKAAAGVAGLIKASLALHHRVLPPSLKVSEPNAALDEAGAFYVNTQKRPWLAKPAHPRRAAVSAFGFGGSNFHCVLEEAPEGGASEAAWDGDVQLLAFSGGSRTALATAIRGFKGADWAQVRQQAFALRESFDASAACRLTLTVKAGDDVGAVCSGAANAVEQDTRARWVSPQGMAFGEGEAQGKLAALFPGQGAQSVNMLRDLCCQFPAMRRGVEQVLADLPSVREALFPANVWTEEARAQQARTLTLTQNAQPALGAVSLGALEVLRGFGVQPQAAVGHSYGELTALCCAGVLPLEALGRVSRSRGELMADGEGERGTMLAAACSLDDLEGHLRDAGLPDVVIANRNSPTQMVCSGSTADIEAAQGHLEGAGVRVRALDVAAAFHSPFVAAARAPFSESLSFVRMGEPSLPVYANVSGMPYEGPESHMRATLVEQIAKPVEFVQCIEAMLADGVDTFVEVGPGRRLSGLVKAIAGDRALTVALDASSGKRHGLVDLAHCLGALAAWGHPVDLHAWDPSPPLPVVDDKPVLRVKVSGANAKPSAAAKPPRAPRPRSMPTRDMPPAAHAATAPAPGPVPATATLPAPAPTAMQRPHGQPAAAQPEALSALLALQEQTARIHQQFLETQAQSLQALGAVFAGASISSPAPLVQPTAPPPLPAPQPPRAAQRPQQTAPVPTPAPRAPTVQTAPATRAPTSVSNVTEDVLAVVAEKTGYPVAMLEPSMGLDADLGIDSIKRVEILSALQERRPDLPAIGPEQLGSLHTLQDVIDQLGGDASTPVPMHGSAAASNVTEDVLAVVAEKTGYPVAMLEPSMGLDADLGIDSIKRVEILSTLQERRPDLPAIGPEQLGSLHTLQDVIDQLGGDVPTPAAANPSANAPAVMDTLLAVVAEKTGYPVAMLEPSMGLDSDLGIDSIKRVEILSTLQERRPDLPAIGPEQLGSLHTLQDVAEALGEGTESAPTPKPASTTTNVAASVDRYAVVPTDLPSEAPRRSLRDGRWFVVGDAELTQALCAAGRDAVNLDANAPVPEQAAGLFIVAPTPCDDAFLERAFATVRGARPVLRGHQDEAALLVVVTRMGGRFGLEGTEHPRHGGLVGLAKTAAREWPDVCVHALDLDDDDTSLRAGIAALGVADTVELGARTGLVQTVGLDGTTPTPASSFALQRDDLVVVSGGARGVTAHVAVAIAAQFGTSMLLLGRSAAPSVAPAWLGDARDEQAIRAALLGQPDAPQTPAQLRDRVWSELSAAQIRDTLARLHAQGVQAEYRSVDVRDRDAVATVLEDAQTTHGPVRMFVHGAGVLADKAIVDKTDEDLRRVYGTKVHGAQHVLDVLDASELRALVMFSSSTGRFGRVGQADYAMANEVLDKLAQRYAAAHPHVCVRAIGWGPWDGGMVTPALSELFAREGVRTIDLDAGARCLLDELSTQGPTEVVVLGSGSRLPDDVSWAPSKSDPSPASSDTSLRGTTVFERTLGLEDHPFLASHAIGGKAVLPAAMMLEWFAHAALAEHPGLRFVGLEDLEVYRGVKIGREERLDVRIEAGTVDKRDGRFHVPMELCSGGTNGNRVLHARTRVVLAAEAPAEQRRDAFSSLPACKESLDSIYRGRLFHGDALRGITSIDGLAEPGINATVRAAPRPKEWMQRPVRGRWITEPLAIDCGLQAVIVWSATQAGSPSLPHKIGTYAQYRAFPPEGAKLGVRIAERSGARVVADLDWLDDQGRLLASLRGGEFTMDAALSGAFSRNRVE